MPYDIWYKFLCLKLEYARKLLTSIHEASQKTLSQQ